MEKETILYNILYIDERAKNIIPEVVSSWNMTPHRFNKEGEMVSLKTNRTMYKLEGSSSSDYVNIDIKEESIDITLEPNTSNSTRQARVTINICDASGCNKLLQFVIHQK